MRLFASEESDDVLYTSDSMAERMNAKGQIRFAFEEDDEIEGDYFAIVTTAGGARVASGWRTFAGTDGETATTTIVTAELDSDSQTAIANAVKASKLVLSATINAGNTGWITIDEPSDELAIAGYLDGCLMVITDTSTGLQQTRWIMAHFLSGGDAGFNPDAAFGFTPVAGDTIDVYATDRWTANVTYWKGTSPLDLSSQRVQVADSAGVTTLTNRLTSLRAANLDNLDAAISVIQSQVTALNNLSAKTNIFGPLLLEIPDSGTRVYVYELVIKDDEDALVALDSDPTWTLVNASGTDRSSLITSSTTIATGRYALTVTVGTSTTTEALKLSASGAVGTDPRFAVLMPQVVDYDSATQINTILTRLGTPAVSVSADIASVKVDTGTTLPGLFATLTTKIRKFFQLSLRKDAAIATDNATELGEINANGGNGSGAYANTTDSQEATVDRGNVAWIGGGSGGGSDATLMLSTVIDSATSQTVLVLEDGSDDNDVYNGQLVVITDAENASQKARVLALDYVGLTKTLTLENAPGFEVAAGDEVSIVAVAGLTKAQQESFDIIEEGASRISGSAIQWIGNVAPGGVVYLTVGDDHVSVIANQVDIPIPDPGGALHAKLNADGVTVQWGAGQGITGGKILGTFVSSSYSNGVTTVRIEVPDCQPTGNIRLEYIWQLQRTLDSKKATLSQGKLFVRADMIEVH
jgi:hypothetical protein